MRYKLVLCFRIDCTERVCADNLPDGPGKTRPIRLAHPRGGKATLVKLTAKGWVERSTANEAFGAGRRRRLPRFEICDHISVDVVRTSTDTAEAIDFEKRVAASQRESRPCSSTSKRGPIPRSRI